LKVVLSNGGKPAPTKCFAIAMEDRLTLQCTHATYQKEPSERFSSKLDSPKKN
jgi:hypothetical protein